MQRVFDIIIIGGGVVGASVAFHLKKLGGGSVLLVERSDICTGGTAKSCAIVRSHYSIPTNTQITVKSLEYFNHFPEMLGDAEASSGFVNCGYLIMAPAGPQGDSVKANLTSQASWGADTREISREEALELHPLLRVDDAAVLGFEPDSGYADPYLTTTGFMNAAKRLGVAVLTECEVTDLLYEGGKITGVKSSQGDFSAGRVLSAIGPWSHAIAKAAGLEIPMEVSRHTVLTFRVAEPYRAKLPIIKDLISEDKIYFRPASGGVVLMGTGDHGEPVTGPDEMGEQVPLDYIGIQGKVLAHRMPAFEQREFIESWVGPYDIMPDWNPVLDAAPGLDGLYLAFGFSGHGFKLAPMIGKLLAQLLLDQPREIDISPYRLSRFAEGDLLRSSYGIGSIS